MSRFLNKSVFELNEIEWWSNWCTLEWLNDSVYLFHSNVFKEELFNRVGYLQGANLLPNFLELAEQKIEKEGARPSVFVFKEDKERIKLKDYKLTDELIVMTLRQKINGFSQVTIEQTTQDKIDEWCKVYLKAFYGELSLYKHVYTILNKLLENPHVQLLHATLGNFVVGVSALYESKECVGVYCVGTLPEFRRKGVATSILKHASEHAENLGKPLVLQTFLADGVQKFYEERGFVKVYSKLVYTKNPRFA